MRKMVMACVAILLVAASAFAQVDTKAKEILDKLSQTTRSYKSIQIEFSFALENKKNNVNQTNEGELVLKGKSYRLHMPVFGMEAFCDGTTIWSYMTDAKECNINGVEEDKDAALNPANIFTMYEKGYTYSFAGEENLAGKPVFVVDLFPIDKSKELIKAKLYIDKTKYQIVKAQTQNKDGNSYLLTLKSMKTNQEFRDDYFKFDKAKYPGVEMNDMR
ncbi:MAG: outer membrane lipoprotein carrier protein LolA [Marinilabiliales bacterium]|nr:outer membrane lipoprotein carrier protein LolA [Marinilabiliales bacterium]